MPTRLPKQAQRFIIAQQNSGVLIRKQDINSIHHFVMDISLNKFDGVWTSSNIYNTFNILYPIIGSTSISHGFNLINPLTSTAANYLTPSGTSMSWGSTYGGAYLTYYNSPSQFDGYIQLNGTNQYIDTSLPTSYLGSGSRHLSLYSLSNVVSSGDDISTQDGMDKLVIQYVNGGVTYSSVGLMSSTQSVIVSNNLSSIGLFEVTSLTSSLNLYSNGVGYSGNPYSNILAVTYSHGQFSTFNPNRGSVLSISADMLTATVSLIGYSTIGKDSGKWYWEIRPKTKNGGGTTDFLVGIGNSINTSSPAGGNINTLGYRDWGPLNGIYYNSGILTPYAGPFGVPYNYTLGQTIGVALDMDLKRLWYNFNGIWGGGNNTPTFSSATGYCSFSGLNGLGLTGSGYIYAVVGFIFGPGTSSYQANFGQSTFSFSVPPGFNPGLFDSNTIQIGKGPDGYSNRQIALMSAGSGHSSDQVASYNNAVINLISNKNIS